MGTIPKLYLLGPGEVRLDGAPRDLSAKQLGLLALLAEAYPRFADRGQLVDLLWPNSGERLGRHSLSQALYAVRKVLGPELVRAEKDRLALHCIECDLHLFRRAVDVGDWTEAADVYRGRFLEGFSLPSNVSFEHWLDGMRSMYEGLAVRVLREPIPENSAERLAGLLSIPRPAISSLGDSGGLPFVGRRAELAKLEELWETAREGQFSLGIVAGSPGIGKTALCSRAVKRAVLKGAKAYVIRGSEGERNLPLGVIGQLLDDLEKDGLLTWVTEPWRTILGSMHAQLASHDARLHSPPKSFDGGVFSLAAALHHLVEAMAPEQPIALFVDDAQWIDEASLSILRYLSRAVVDQPVFMVMAVRTGAAFDTVRLQWPATLTLELRGLNEAETEALVRKAGSTDRWGAQGAVTVFELSRGNPLLIQALLEAEYHDKSLGPGAKQYFSAQLKRLSADAQLVGAAIAVVGNAVESNRLKWLTQLDDDQANTALEDLLGSGYVALDHSSGQFALKHHLIADAFLENVRPIARARLHRRAGTLMRNEGRPSAVVATQFAIAGSRRDACQAALSAARGSLDLFAYNEAEYFLRIAVNHADDLETEATARGALADLLLQRGRYSEARTAIEGLSVGLTRLFDSFPELEAQRLIALVGHPTDRARVEETYRAARDLVGSIPPRRSARVYFRIARSAYQIGLVELAQRCVEESLSHLRQASKGPETAKYEVLALACDALWGGQFENERRLSEVIAESSTVPSTYVSGLLARASIHHMQGRAQAAERDLLSAVETCERYGLVVQQLTATCNLAVSYMEQGSWDEAVHHIESIIHSPTASIIAPHEVLNAMANRQIICYESGQYEDAISWGNKVLEADRGASHVHISALGVRGLSELAIGRLASARESEAQLRRLLEPHSVWSHDVSYVEVLLARLTNIGGNGREAVARLRGQIEVFSQRDFYCAARMEVELLRLKSREEPAEVHAVAVDLRDRLAQADAHPLVAAVNDIVRRSRLHNGASPR